MSDFFDRHGAVLLLYSIVLGGIALTFYLGIHAHIDGDKLFVWFGGFTMGAFSGLTVAMKVGGNGVNKSTPPPTVPPSAAVVTA